MKRKFWLTVHLLSAGAWIGVDVIVAVLVAVGAFGGADSALAYRALGTFVVWPMLTSGVICLITGLVLGWTTKWGLLRYWWVAVKLALNLVLCTLILVALQPGMADVRAYGEGRLETFDPAGLAFPPIVSLTALSFATVLAVYKPWGRIRRGPTARTPRRPAASTGRTEGA